MDRANLRKANFSGANLQESFLWGANLQEAKLGKADLQKANLRKANFSNTYLTYSNLKDADLYLTTFDNSNLYDANIDGIVINERKGDKIKYLPNKLAKYREGLEIYLNLENYFENEGIHGKSEYYHTREQKVRKKIVKLKKSLTWIHYGYRDFEMQ